MVRLKAKGPSILTENLFNFNSTMVRLKVIAGLSISDLFSFQFHYGSVKSWNYSQPFKK